jgi:hypothetical protein
MRNVSEFLEDADLKTIASSDFCLIMKIMKKKIKNFWFCCLQEFKNGYEASAVMGSDLSKV